MTPFGAKLRRLRAARNLPLKDMAAALGISAAYLSALEHGHRGRPSSGLVQQISAYFNLAWDDVDELKRLAEAIGALDEAAIERLLEALEAS